MSWAEHHKQSEKFAVAAELAMRNGDTARAEGLYLQAANAEREAFLELEPTKVRTLGITAVSASSLYFKGKNFAEAEALAYAGLNQSILPIFAREQLKGLLQAVWNQAAVNEAGLQFSKRDVLIAVKGGNVIRGGAPLDLILRKVEEVRALFYRTVEMLMNRSFRTRGGPPMDILQGFRPWLFHAPPSSYQFAVRLESISQLEFNIFDHLPLPEVELVTTKFLEIVEAASTDPETLLPQVVPDTSYRGAFLKLTRSLVPTGKSYSSLEIKSATDPSMSTISLVPDMRPALTASIRHARQANSTKIRNEPVTLKGILRAVHLDQDWLEVTVFKEGLEHHIRVDDANDAIDDVVGPMVNRPVEVKAVIVGNKYHFVDIESVD